MTLWRWRLRWRSCNISSQLEDFNLLLEQQELTLRQSIFVLTTKATTVRSLAYISMLCFVSRLFVLSCLWLSFSFHLLHGRWCYQRFHRDAANLLYIWMSPKTTLLKTFYAQKPAVSLHDESHLFATSPLHILDLVDACSNCFTRYRLSNGRRCQRSGSQRTYCANLATYGQASDCCTCSWFWP